jgi:hypothetical protein
MTARHVLFGLGSAAVAAAFALGIAGAARAGSTDALFGRHALPAHTAMETRVSLAQMGAGEWDLLAGTVPAAGQGAIDRLPSGGA